MPAIKARKISASNMTTPVNLQQRVWNGSAYVWQTVQQDLFCEFRTVQAKSVMTGMMTIGARKHDIYTRYQSTIVPGMRMYDYVHNTYLYIMGVIDVEQVHQWLNIEAMESVLDTAIDIIPVTHGKGTYAQSTLVEGTHVRTMAIFAEPAPGPITILADRVGMQNFWAVGVPEDTVVHEGDEIQIVDTGEKYKVHSVRSPMSFKPLLTLFVGNQS